MMCATRFPGIRAGRPNVVVETDASTVVCVVSLCSPRGSVIYILNVRKV